MNDMRPGYDSVIAEICGLDWGGLNQEQRSAVGWAYYFFSVQFRESLETTLNMYPDDPQLRSLLREECRTTNLSPWPDVAAEHEAMDHDEFMRRVLTLTSIDTEVQRRIVGIGTQYLEITRAMDDTTKAMVIASYEGGGLERVFTAMLTGDDWNTPLLAGFHHFLVKHISFDSNPNEGHGALVQHLRPDERIRPMWEAFRDLLVAAVPRLAA